MSNETTTDTPPAAPAVGAQVERLVRPWEKCREHGPAQQGVWACPVCLVELRRWRSTNAPRLEALQGLLNTAQSEAAAGREAITSLASERAANALLTDEVERLREALADAMEVGGHLMSASAYERARALRDGA